MSGEAAGGAVEAAALRLEQGVAELERSFSGRIDTAGRRAVAEAEKDRARLTAELDAARARERALETVAAEASAALGRAADEVRAALQAEVMIEAAEPGEAEPSAEDGVAPEDAPGLLLGEAG